MVANHASLPHLLMLRVTKRHNLKNVYTILPTEHLHLQFQFFIFIFAIRYFWLKIIA